MFCVLLLTIRINRIDTFQINRLKWWFIVVVRVIMIFLLLLLLVSFNIILTLNWLDDIHVTYQLVYFVLLFYSSWFILFLLIRIFINLLAITTRLLEHHTPHHLGLELSQLIVFLFQYHRRWHLLQLYLSFESHDLVLESLILF